MKSILQYSTTIISYTSIMQNIVITKIFSKNIPVCCPKNYILYLSVYNTDSFLKLSQLHTNCEEQTALSENLWFPSLCFRISHRYLLNILQKSITVGKVYKTTKNYDVKIFISWGKYILYIKILKHEYLFLELQDEMVIIEEWRKHTQTFYILNIIDKIKFLHNYDYQHFVIIIASIDVFKF